MTDTAADVVRTYLDVMTELDMERFADLLADDIVIRLPYAPGGLPRRVAGKAAVVELYSAFPRMLSPLGLHDIDIRALDAPGQFVATYRSDGTFLPTGRPHRNEFIALFTVRDGKLAAFTEYFDPLVFLDAQGVTVPAAGGAR